MRKRYAVVGLGVRGIYMFLKSLLKEYTDVAEVVALCDVNPKRLAVAVEEAGRPIATYTDFDAMLRDVAIDAVIIATKDSEHDSLIVKALTAGIDVITEKPMTIDDERCRRILEAEQNSPGSVKVTFNYRYTPYVTRVKELLQSGIIGNIHSVQFAWYLDTVHGAEYYRRWHRNKESSGGLLVHKSTHHFDVINWWLGQDPVQVFALGDRNFYGPTRNEHGTRCLTCHVTDTCEFYMDLRKDDLLRRLYLDAETEDGYFRDQCVFDPSINIEDTMSAVVRYSGGTQLSYSLHAFAPFEGWRAVLNGSRGRMEIQVSESFYPEAAPRLSDRVASRVSAEPWQAADALDGGGANGKSQLQNERRVQLHTINSDVIRIYPLYGGAVREEVPRVRGGHGGGDQRLRDMLFRPGTPDPLGHSAGSRAGAMSILIGVGANQSIASGQPVIIADLLGDSGGTTILGA